GVQPDGLPSAGASPQASPDSQSAQPTGQSPLDAALRLVADAKGVYQRVTDYTCTMISQERINGRLGPENIIQLEFRQNPFSVHMRWLGPHEVAGRDVVYVHGRNGNKMRVREGKGIAAIMGKMDLDPNDPKVRQHSRHVITETGIGNLLEQF